MTCDTTYDTWCTNNRHQILARAESEFYNCGRAQEMGILLFLDTCLARYEDMPAVEKCERTVKAGSVVSLFFFLLCHV